MLYNNNDTIVTSDELLDNMEGLVAGTIKRKAKLIILDAKTQEVLLVLHHTDLINYE